MLHNPITIGLSPNIGADDVWCAVKMLVSPHLWQSGGAIEKGEQWFEREFPGYEAVSFNSGRSALLALLTAQGIGSGDEVIIQAFTCVAVPDSVLWAGATPNYCDIDETLNIDPELLEKSITKKTRAIIVQHTLGIPAKIDLIKKIAQKYGILLIEDCAHSLGATYKGRKLGSWGDAAIFSFGRDKIVSSVFGGMAIIDSKLKAESKELKAFHQKLPYPGIFWILQQLLHPILTALVLPVYSIGIGKALLVFFQKLHLLSFPVYQEEKRGKKPGIFPKKYPNALACLLLTQLEKLEAFTERRKEIAKAYVTAFGHSEELSAIPASSGAVYLRFPLLTAEANTILAQAKKKGIILGNWYHNVIDPEGVDFAAVGYEEGFCPIAELAAETIINLPTYPRMTDEDVQRVIDIWKQKK